MTENVLHFQVQQLVLNKSLFNSGNRVSHYLHFIHTQNINGEHFLLYKMILSSLGDRPLLNNKESIFLIHILV